MINVVYCTDKNYLKPTSVSIISLLENNKNEKFSLYILQSHLLKSYKDFIENKIKKYKNNTNLYFIDIPENTFSKLPIHGRSKAAYYRLLIPELLAKSNIESIDRCLYLDSDILVKNDISEFYNSDFKDKAFVVTEDMGEVINFHKQRHKILDITTEYKYFNSGVLLFNLNFFKNFDMKIVYDWIEKNHSKLKFLDQDVLNANFCDKVIFNEGYKYDFLEILMSPLLPQDGFKNAVIIHYLKKPWLYSYNGINSSAWWKYGKEIYSSFDHYKFLIINYIYRSIFSFVNIFVPIYILKKIKFKFINKK